MDARSRGEEDEKVEEKILINGKTMTVIEHDPEADAVLLDGWDFQTPYLVVLGIRKKPGGEYAGGLNRWFRDKEKAVAFFNKEKEQWKKTEVKK